MAVRRMDHYLTKYPTLAEHAAQKQDAFTMAHRCADDFKLRTHEVQPLTVFEFVILIEFGCAMYLLAFVYLIVFERWRFWE